MMSEAFLGLGSNLGDRRTNICLGVRGVEEISSHLALSSLYETAPKGFGDQPAFLNAVCRIWTRLDPFELLRAVRDIQMTVGGRPAFTNGPRALDIDLLTYGGLVMDAPTLRVPHPRMAEREFVLRPLAEIAPEARHPISGETFGALLLRLTSTGEASYSLIEGGRRFGIVSSIG